jgi:hypothetical protein
MAVALVVVVGGIGGAKGQNSTTSRASLDARDALLAALGTATLECLGTVSPASYSTTSGALARTFDACPAGGPSALARIEALLGVQFSEPGRTDLLADYYVGRWNVYTESFPFDQRCARRGRS